MPALEPALSLICHPKHPAAMVRAVNAAVARTSDGGLVLSYQVSGDMARLRIPVPQEPRRSDGLWEHTCFEAFVALAGAAAYRELNFSPSGQWAAYEFSSYRRLQHTHAVTTPPQIRASLTAGHLQLFATLAADLLPPGAAGAALQIGLSAVIESSDTVAGERSYWALHHGPGSADFHRRDTFVLELPPDRSL